MTQSYVNKFGRKPGRGIRPWLLLPKIIAIAIYLGGLASVLAIWIFSDVAALSLADPRRQFIIDLVGGLMVRLVIPALVLALLLGVGLFFQYPRHFPLIRWWQTKMILLAIVIPTSHFFCRWQFLILRHTDQQAASALAASRLAWGLAFALLGSILVVILGRLKPRLGQNPASVAARLSPSPPASLASPASPTSREAPPTD
ncbi:hypothetical protein [Fontivita pretiosa]|uniref:hypothetical protein n=1 Tax=Fontivita pretiosa TaxID=2989684 RepID=UPI003D16B47D